MATTVTEAEEFGAAVRHYRTKQGWQRPELAMRLALVDPAGNWTKQKVTNVERGAIRHPPLREIRMLSIVLGCEIADLVWPKPGVVTQEYAIGALDLVGSTPTPLAGDPHPPIERPEIHLPHAA